jgi:predicted dehydrogenase
VGVDRDAEKRRAFEAGYGGPSYETMSAALGEHRPDVIVIATPTATHGEVLADALAHSTPRIILCEKPLAYQLGSAEAMLAACEERGVALYVNYMRRSDPAVIAVTRMLERGEILAPVSGVVWYSKGLLHNGSHFVDLMRLWLGPVERATLIRAGRRWPPHDYEPDFVMEHARGRVTFLAAAEERFSHYTVELLAGNGRLRYEQGGERVEWQAVTDDDEFIGYRVLAREAQVLPADMSRYQHHVATQLALALAGKSASLCSGREGLETLRDVNRVVELL